MINLSRSLITLSLSTLVTPAIGKHFFYLTSIKPTKFVSGFQVEGSKMSDSATLVPPAATDNVTSTNATITYTPIEQVSVCPLNFPCKEPRNCGTVQIGFLVSKKRKKRNKKGTLQCVHLTNCGQSSEISLSLGEVPHPAFPVGFDQVLNFQQNIEEPICFAASFATKEFSHFHREKRKAVCRWISLIG